MSAPARSRDEHGGVIVMSVVLMSLVILLAAIVIDVGVKRIVRTDMQSVADVMALDLARTIDGKRTKVQLLASAEFATAKADSLARNGPSAASNLDDSDVVVAFGVGDADGRWQRDAADAEVPNAVRVTVTGTAQAQLLAGAGPSRTSRDAVAVNPALACFSVGSSLAQVRSGDSVVLRGILNDSLGANVVSAAGIAALDTTVPIAAVQARLGLATADQLLAVGLPTFLSTAVDVVGAGSTAGLQLAAIAARLGTSGLKVGDVLGVETGGANGLGAALNLLDLVTAGVIAADSDSALRVPNAGLNLGTLTNVNVTAKVVERHKNVACGPIGTTARQSQIEVTVSAKVGLGINVVDLSLVVNAANVDGALTAIRCTPDHLGIAARTSTAGGKLTLSLVGGLAGVDVPLNVLDSPDRTVALDFPPETAEVSGASSLGLTGTVNLRLAGLVTVPVNLATLVPGGLNNLLSGIVASVLGALGVSVNGGQFAAVSHPVCDQPALRE